jgi:hypothetical protein
MHCLRDEAIRLTRGVIDDIGFFSRAEEQERRFMWLLFLAGPFLHEIDDYYGLAIEV